MPAARASLLAGLTFALATGAVSLSMEARHAATSSTAATASSPPADTRAAVPDPGRRIAALLRSDQEREFQSAFGELAQLMERDRAKAAALAASVTAEYSEALAAGASQAARARAMNRLQWMARAGDGAAAQRIAAFEKNYDSVKQSVARTEWWSLGRGERPEAAVRWMEDGALLARHGDRPAMLDLAFALGHGRGEQRDRLAALETYLKVIDRSPEDDPGSAKIRRAALRGLGSLLNSIVEQKDEAAARSVLPVLQARAEAGASDLQYFSGLISECALNPADLAAAGEWYRKAAAASDWKLVAEQKTATLGKWCPERR
jgi:TPR repeat protein